MNKKEFINSIKEEAIRGQRDYGILASLTMAQAILESGWGESALTQKGNNLFGVKAFSSWKGKKVTMETTEWYDGKKQIVSADFRAYESFNDSIKDHSKLLSNFRYTPVRQCTYYKAACSEVYKCGYATDPKYPEKLMNIIEIYKLYEFDANDSQEEAAADICTEKVRKFQHLCNFLGIRDYEGKELKEDNVLGERTRSCICKMPVLKVGARGEVVSFIQEVLGMQLVDGKFGTITAGAVIKFQKSQGLEADGIVGVNTWSRLMPGVLTSENMFNKIK